MTLKVKGSLHKTPVQLEKSPTGITGLDEITGGGLPKGRPTLVVGKAGAGKTLLAMEFLVRGAVTYNEPGVFMSFEETADDLTKNVASLGYDLNDLQEKGLLNIDHVIIERSQIEETGEYDLEALFIRLNYAIDSVGAKRVVLDTIESIFSGLADVAVLRAELRRLFLWLKEKGVTAIITGEAGEGSSLTRHGLEEYVSDCVIALDHRVDEQISTRRLRVVKYRGSFHGTNEYPFLIDEYGISVLPVTSLGLAHTASNERISSGIPRLDAMLGGQGYYRGSTVMLTGPPGTGKTSFAASFVNATCLRGERALYFAFEESPDQIVRNMRSIGIDLAPHIENGLLEIHSSRPTLFGLEMHLVMMLKQIREVKPDVVVIDPMSDLISIGTAKDVRVMVARLMDFLKTHQVTAIFTHLIHSAGKMAGVELAVSSLIDTLISLQDIESAGERNRGLSIIKSRGMAHSNQIREYTITDSGIEIADVYLGPAGMYTGTARYVQEAQDRAELESYGDLIRAQQQELERKRRAMEAQIQSLRDEFEAHEESVNRQMKSEKLKQQTLVSDLEKIGKLRRADQTGGSKSQIKESNRGAET
jgi:circadian clock protein KaiC